MKLHLKQSLCLSSAVFSLNSHLNPIEFHSAPRGVLLHLKPRINCTWGIFPYAKAAQNLVLVKTFDSPNHTRDKILENKSAETAASSAALSWNWPQWLTSRLWRMCSVEVQVGGFTVPYVHNF